MRYALQVFCALVPLQAVGVRAIASGEAKPNAERIDGHIKKMIEPTASLKARWAAEDALLKLAPQEILPRLLPLLAKGMPSGGIWNSTGTREADSKGPVEWQIYYAIHRIWHQQLGSLPRDTAGNLLADLLPGITKDKERFYVLHALANHWHPSAEGELAKLLRDTGQSRETRLGAAFPLILHGDEDYRDVMLQAAAKANHDEKVRWFELLYDPRYKKRKGADPRVTTLGCQLILAEKARNPDYIHGAYFLARKVGQYVGEEFAPSTRDPKYADKKGGLRDAFFEDTVANAVRWWEKNRDKIEPK